MAPSVLRRSLLQHAVLAFTVDVFAGRRLSICTQLELEAAQQTALQRLRSVTGARHLNGLGVNAVIAPPWPGEGRTTAVGWKRTSLSSTCMGGQGFWLETRLEAALLHGFRYLTRSSIFLMAESASLPRRSSSQIERSDLRSSASPYSPITWSENVAISAVPSMNPC